MLKFTYLATSKLLYLFIDWETINSPFEKYVINHAFITWIFFTALWRTIKSSGWGGSGWKNRKQKIITKSKRNKNLKMPSFCAAFNCSDRLISNFYDFTDSEHKFQRTKIENWLSIGFGLEYHWLRTYSHNHYTRFNWQYDGES